MENVCWWYLCLHTASKLLHFGGLLISLKKKTKNSILTLYWTDLKRHGNILYFSLLQLQGKCKIKWSLNLQLLFAYLFFGLPLTFELLIAPNSLGHPVIKMTSFSLWLVHSATYRALPWGLRVFRWDEKKGKKIQFFSLESEREK